MAKHVIETVTDDLDGSPDAEPFSFSVQGISYSLDLGEKNRTKLLRALEPYALDKFRTSTVRFTPKAGRVGSKAVSDDTYARRWFRSNGQPVSDRGRMKPGDIEAWREAGSIKLDS